MTLTDDRRARRRGLCSHCGRGPREIAYRHPATSKPVCQTCSFRIRGMRRRLRRGPCPDCPAGRGPRLLQYRDEDRNVWVCKTCFYRLTGRREKRRKKQCQRCGHESRHVAFRRRCQHLLCDACHDRQRGRRRPRAPVESCPNCGRRSREVQYRHGGVRWCLTCHRKAIRYMLPRGECFECGCWRELSRRHWDFDLVVCRPCFIKHRRRGGAAPRVSSL